jgi:NADH:ubiquinone oxidoreductase subunit 4 (subunit M)
MMLPLLPLILIIPIIGSLILLIIDRKDLVNGDPFLLKNNEIRLKQVALSTSLINFFVSLFIWFNFDSNISQYQFVLEFNQLGLFDLNFGIDAISLYFVLLTTFITPIALLSNYSNLLGKEAENIKFFLISILLLESLQICAFVSLDLLLFYIFFESAKICGLYLLCLQLSKSGNSLKLLVPYFFYKQLNIYIIKNDFNYIFIFNFSLGSNYINFTHNNWVVVIIQKIYENK